MPPRENCSRSVGAWGGELTFELRSSSILRTFYKVKTNYIEGDGQWRGMAGCRCHGRAQVRTSVFAQSALRRRQASCSEERMLLEPIRVEKDGVFVENEPPDELRILGPFRLEEVEAAFPVPR